jgi:hypothetical protein
MVPQHRYLVVVLVVGGLAFPGVNVIKLSSFVADDDA